jgi:group I intron endonuclease
MIIYKATINNKSYIGRTIGTLEERTKQHLKESKRNAKWYFYRAIHKHGKQNIKWEIIEDNIEDFNLLKERETFNIIKYDTLKPNGYNMTLGGEGIFGLKHSEQSKKKMSEYQRKRTYEHQENISKGLKGKPLSEEHKEKIRQFMLGRKLSKETRQKLSTSLKGKIFTKEHRENLRKSAIGHKRCVGRVLSEETKDKIRKAHLGKKHSTKTKRKMSQSHYEN